MKNPSSPKPSPTLDSQETETKSTIVTKEEMLRRIDEAYELGSLLQQRVGYLTDIMEDQLNPTEGFPSPEMSLAQVEKIYQTLEKVQEKLEEEFGEMPINRYSSDVIN